jgi:hypothetical protein
MVKRVGTHEPERSAGHSLVARARSGTVCYNFSMSLKEPTHLAWDDRLAEGDKKFVGDLNASLDRLSGMRALEINVSGKFLRSKIAWKLAT